MTHSQSNLQHADKELYDIVQAERNRQNSTIELIASENFTSPAVMETCGSVLTNKYAEGYPGKRYYGGCEFVDMAENLAIERVKKIFGATYANVQPHAGSQANMAVLFSVMNAGDKMLGFNLSHGGHLTHGSPVSFSGKLFEAHFYGVNESTGRVDMNEVEFVAKKIKPKVIIAGASAYSRDWDFKAFRTIADSVGAIVMADIAHPAGLVAVGEHSSPIPHCHIVTSTTHKTLRGPRGGIIMMGQDFENPKGLKIKTKTGERVRLMSEVLDLEVMPGIQGGPLMHIIAAKAVAFKEVLHPEFKTYIQQVKKNASTMVEEFQKQGYNIVSGGTDNHLMLIDLRNKNISGKEAENLLHHAGMTANKNLVPFDDKSPFITSGIRIGTAAITTRGFKESECKHVVELIDKVLSNATSSDKEKICANVLAEIKTMMVGFPLYQ